MISVRFLFHDSSLSNQGYDFSCMMRAVPRVGDSVILSSTDPSDPLVDSLTGMTAFSARVASVTWAPMPFEIDDPDVIIEADIEWV